MQIAVSVILMICIKTAEHIIELYHRLQQCYFTFLTSNTVVKFSGAILGGGVKCRSGKPR